MNFTLRRLLRSLPLLIIGTVLLSGCQSPSLRSSPTPGPQRPISMQQVREEVAGVGGTLLAAAPVGFSTVFFYTENNRLICDSATTDGQIISGHGTASTGHPDPKYAIPLTVIGHHRIPNHNVLCIALHDPAFQANGVYIRISVDTGLRLDVPVGGQPGLIVSVPYADFTEQLGTGNETVIQVYDQNDVLLYEQSRFSWGD